MLVIGADNESCCVENKCLVTLWLMMLKRQNLGINMLLAISNADNENRNDNCWC